MRIFFTHRFLKMANSLSIALQKELQEKVEMFQIPANHQSLKLHKLKGHLDGFFSFSVNYKTRVICEKVSEGFVLHAVGDHDVYQ